MQNKLLLLVAALSLAGCATNAPPGINTVIQRVEVPIAVPCKVEIPVKPAFNFDKLTTDQTIFDKTKAALADRKLQLAYEIELLGALKSCM